MLAADGSEWLEDELDGPKDDARELGAELVRRLLARGAGRLVEAQRA